MKVLAVVASLFAVSAGSAISLIPGNNSGYVEGVSRYVWMPDGNAVPHLVDLQAPIDYAALNRSGTNNQYFLYTRENPSTFQSLMLGDINSVASSNYDPNLSTKVIVHGWHDNSSSDFNILIRDAFLDTFDCNVIVVDWSQIADFDYITASIGVKSAGEHLGEFLLWLFSSIGGSWDQLHLVGHSLGAHVVGVAGRFTGGLPRRVEGLDPAGPLWYGNPKALSTASGIHVEVIHTDAGVQGIYKSIGHADFYPNGGTNPQPGCKLSTSCSHAQSTRYYAASILYDLFVANQCSSMLEVTLDTCSGATLNMGNGIMTKTGSGIYRLKTRGVWPYYETMDDK